MSPLLSACAAWAVTQIIVILLVPHVATLRAAGTKNSRSNYDVISTLLLTPLVTFLLIPASFRFFAFSAVCLLCQCVCMIRLEQRLLYATSLEFAGSALMNHVLLLLTSGIFHHTVPTALVWLVSLVTMLLFMTWSNAVVRAAVTTEWVLSDIVVCTD